MKIITGTDAKGDMKEAGRWYEDQRLGLGLEITIEIAEVIERITEMPKLYPTNHLGLRRATLQRFPYAVYYKLSRNTLEIVAFLHYKRNPKMITRTLKKRQ